MSQLGRVFHCLDHRGHSSSIWTVPPITETVAGVGVTADGFPVDMPLLEAMLEQSPSHRIVQMDVRPWLIGAYAVFKPRIGEGSGDFLAHFEVLHADRGSDRCNQVPGVRSVVPSQRLDRGSRSVRHRSSPAGMNRGHRSTVRVMEQDGNAVGDPDHQETVRPVGYKDVGPRWWPGSRSTFIDHELPAVDLVQQQGSVGIRDAQLLAKGSFVGFGGDEIGAFAASTAGQIEGCLVSGRLSAVPGRECVGHPVLSQLQRLPHDDATSENDPFQGPGLVRSAPPAGVSSSGFHLERFYHG